MHRESGKVSDLGEALEAYAAHARHRKRTTPAHAAAYSAAAGAALALAPSADAAIQHTDIEDVTRVLASTGNDQTGYPVDLDGDSVNDFTFLIERIIGGSLGSQRSQTLKITSGPGGLGVVAGAPPDVNRLSAGMAINNTDMAAATRLRAFTSINGSSGFIDGTWPGNSMNLASAGLVGVKFNHADNTHFGWIRIGITNEATGAPFAFTVYDWAWEDVPDTPITAGLIPEPSPIAGLALLAAGAAGVGAWRRRKMAKG